jgi:hypothetical protein
MLGLLVALAAVDHNNTYLSGNAQDCSLRNCEYREAKHMLILARNFSFLGGYATMASAIFVYFGNETFH